MDYKLLRSKELEDLTGKLYGELCDALPPKLHIKLGEYTFLILAREGRITEDGFMELKKIIDKYSQ